MQRKMSADKYKIHTSSDIHDFLILNHRQILTMFYSYNFNAYTVIYLSVSYFSVEKRSSSSAGNNAPSWTYIKNSLINITQ